jgi:hypothetical protein
MHSQPISTSNFGHLSLMVESLLSKVPFHEATTIRARLGAARVENSNEIAVWFAFAAGMISDVHCGIFSQLSSHGAQSRVGQAVAMFRSNPRDWKNWGELAQEMEVHAFDMWTDPEDMACTAVQEAARAAHILSLELVDGDLQPGAVEGLIQERARFQFAHHAKTAAEHAALAPALRAYQDAVEQAGGEASDTATFRQAANQKAKLAEQDAARQLLALLEGICRSELTRLPPTINLKDLVFKPCPKLEPLPDHQMRRPTNAEAL